VKNAENKSCSSFNFLSDECNSFQIFCPNFFSSPLLQASTICHYGKSRGRLIRTGRESIINESNHDLESFFCDSWFGFESFLKSINDLWFVIRFIFLLVVNESNTFQITRFIRFGAISSVPEPVYSFQNEVTPLWSRFVRFGFDLKLIRILFILIDLES